MTQHGGVDVAAAVVGAAECFDPAAKTTYLVVVDGMQGDKSVEMKCQFVVGGIGVD